MRPLDRNDLSRLLLEIYSLLYRRYGSQGWWPGDGPLDVVIGAILTQAAAWTNVEMAIANMKNAGCWSLGEIDRLPEQELAAIIRPSGYFNAKARKLKAFAQHVQTKYQGSLEGLLSQPVEKLRVELLSIHGVGPETADDIMVYAAGKPSFVIDAYTRRIVQRLGIAPESLGNSYSSYQALFQNHLPSDAALFNEYHALLDRHAKDACAKVPRCGGCCLRKVCVTGQTLEEHSS